jgi:hypothetical protein
MLGQYHVTATGWAAASLVVTFALFLLSLFIVFPGAALNKMCGLLLFAIAYRLWGRQLGMALSSRHPYPVVLELSDVRCQ